MIVYKFDVLEKLKAAGYSSYAIRHEKLMPESALTSLRSGRYVQMSTIDTICRLLGCQPGDISAYVDTAPEE